MLRTRRPADLDSRDVTIAGVAPPPARRDVLRLDRRHLVVPDLAEDGLHVQSVEPRRVAAEDGALHDAVGRAERSEPVFALHLLGDLETAQRLDLPLRPAVPERARAPQPVPAAQPRTS